MEMALAVCFILLIATAPVQLSPELLSIISLYEMCQSIKVCYILSQSAVMFQTPAARLTSTE